MGNSSIELDPELIKDFVNEVMESLDAVESHFIELEKNPSDLGVIDAVFRAIHSIKGNSAYFNWKHVKLFAHNLENVLDELRQGKKSVTREMIDGLISGTGYLKKMVQRTAAGDLSYEILPDEQEFLKNLELMAFNIVTLEDSLKRFVEKIQGVVQKAEGQSQVSGEVLLGQLKAHLNDQQMKTSILSADAPVVAAVVAVTEPLPQKKNSVELEEEGMKTIRVNIEKVDEFMNYVGELIIMSDLFNGIQKNLEKYSQDADVTVDFKQAYLAFDKLSTGLQKSLMEVRKIPLKSLLQKVPKVVRDLARKEKKEVEVEISGGSNLLDKSLIENLEAPLNHMVRNSVDHGLETSEERKANGKSPVGKIEVHAELSQDHFSLIIRDDGRGIDPIKMRHVSVKKGMLTEAQAAQLSDADAINLIFKPGFSSAETVTDVSGRGVGMDVVFKNVHKCKGVINVESTVGKGTVITTTIPLSAALMVENGLMVEVRDERYVFPAMFVCEILPFHQHSQVTAIGTSQVIKVRDRIYPLVQLESLLACKGPVRPSQNRQVIVAESEKSRCCFVVDDIIGIQQVVVREMMERYKAKDIVKGIAILGHSKPVVVLDIAAMIRTLGARSGSHESLALANVAA